MIRLDGDVDRLLEPGGGARLGVARSRGPVTGATEDACAWVLVERGSGRLHAGGAVVDVAGRATVFDGPGWSLLLGGHTAFALDGDLDATIAWRASTRAAPGGRAVPPAAVAEEVRGAGTTARRVRTYQAAGELIVGETLNPPGGWSSWPPHRHAHEEIYLYRFDPPHGFGVHADLAAGRSPRVVRDGDVVRIVDGEHPVVAAPGCAMYYLWALAGDSDTVDTRVDSRFA